MSNVVGTWTINIDWDCDGMFDGIVKQTFKANGTWVIKGDFPHTGRWFQSAGLIVWVLEDVPELIFSANIAGSSMSGVHGYARAKGKKGCFSGQKNVLFRPPPAGVSKAHDAVLGK